MTNIFTLEPATEEGIVLQTNHYYPFGMSYATNAQSSIAQPWRFGGKELMCDAALDQDFTTKDADSEFSKKTIEWLKEFGWKKLKTTNEFS